MYLFEFTQNSKAIKTTIASSSRDLELRAELEELRGTYGKSVKAHEVGVYCIEKARVALYSDLELNARKEVKSMKQPMIADLINGNFSNDNMTYFMLERGLVNEARNALSEKGKELVNAFKKDFN